MELMKDYDLTIHYHPEKTNVVAVVGREEIEETSEDITEIER